MNFPIEVQDITPTWLTAALHDHGVLPDLEISSIETQLIGAESGFLSRVARVTVQYSSPQNDAPSTMVVKLPPPPDPDQDQADDLHPFAREINFYREVAPTAPLRIPQIYGIPEVSDSSALIMEDLNGCRMGDQVKGLHTEQVKLAARSIARLQARYWNNAALDTLDWMPFGNHIEVNFSTRWPDFIGYYGGDLPPAAVQIGERLCEDVPKLFERIDARPKTIVHQDLRADNMAFFDDEAGKEDIVIFDWQIAVRSMGAFDIARLLGGSELPEERQGHQLEILQAWHRALIDEGITDYTEAEAVHDFRLGTLAALCYPVHFFGELPSAETRTAQLFRAIASRLFRSAVEIDAISSLD